MTLEGQPWSSGQAPRTSVSDGLLALEEAHRAKRRSSAPILSRPWPAALIQSPTVWGYRKEDKIPTVSPQHTSHGTLHQEMDVSASCFPHL